LFLLDKNPANPSGFPDLLTGYRDTAAELSPWGLGAGNGVSIRHRQVRAQRLWLPEMGRQGQPVCRFRGDWWHGDRDQRRRAGMVLGHLGETMVELSGRDIPRLAASLQLSAQSASLASQGPALLASRNDEALNERAKAVKETQAIVVAKLAEAAKLGADKTVVANLTETVKNIDDMINSLGSAARERLEAAAQHEKQYQALRTAQAGFVAAANPAMLDAQTQINAILGSANMAPDDATQAARTIEQLGNVVSSSNLMASNMAAVLTANSNCCPKTPARRR